MARMIFSSFADPDHSTGKTRSGIIFAFLAIPAIPTLFSEVAQIIPATMVPCPCDAKLARLSPTKSFTLLAP